MQVVESQGYWEKLREWGKKNPSPYRTHRGFPSQKSLFSLKCQASLPFSIYVTGSHFFPVPFWDSDTLASLETCPSGRSPSIQEQESHSQNSSASWEKKKRQERGWSLQQRRISATSKTLATILKPFHSAKSKHTLRYFSASAYDPNAADEFFDISPMLLS